MFSAILASNILRNKRVEQSIAIISTAKNHIIIGSETSAAPTTQQYSRSNIITATVAALK
jgi:hypothetical protein